MFFAVNVTKSNAPHLYCELSFQKLCKKEAWIINRGN